VRIIDEHLPEIEEWVERTHGKIRADVAHERLVALGGEEPLDHRGEPSAANPCPQPFCANS